MLTICNDVAALLRRAFNGVPGVTVELEDSCDPTAEAEKALGGWGVLVLVAASGHRRSQGSGASTGGDVAVELTVVENPKRNRKSGTPGPTVTSVAETARDALHWQFAEAFCLNYVDMHRADVAEDDFRMVVDFTAQPFTPQLQTGAGADAPEPEEIVERRIVANLAASLPGWKVLGKLVPAPEGEMREVPDTCVIVSADVASQNMDWCGPGVPCTYRAKVEVRCSAADDRTGAMFRNVCRTVRAALQSLFGDRCAALDGEGFECDSFVLGSTNTPTEDRGESAAETKTYTAAVVGRFNPQTGKETE